MGRAPQGPGRVNASDGRPPAMPGDDPADGGAAADAGAGGAPAFEGERATAGDGRQLEGAAAELAALSRVIARRTAGSKSGQSFAGSSVSGAYAVRIQRISSPSPSTVVSQQFRGILTA